MGSFEQVLNVFSDYLAGDSNIEVVMTSRGYTVLGWEDHVKNWETSECCPTPESLFNILAYSFADYRELSITGGDRDLTPQESDTIKLECDSRKALCE